MSVTIRESRNTYMAAIAGAVTWQNLTTESCNDA